MKNSPTPELNKRFNFLNLALGSLGESVSGRFARRQANPIKEEDFQKLDAMADKPQNGLLKLVKRLERKRATGDWTDHLLVKENVTKYAIE